MEELLAPEQVQGRLGPVEMVLLAFIVLLVVLVLPPDLLVGGDTDGVQLERFRSPASHSF